MKTMILAAAIAVTSFAAYADTTSSTRCWRIGRSGMNCESQTETPYASTTTQCMYRGRAGSACETERVEKKRPKPPEPPRPVLPPSETMTPVGVVIVRGMPVR